MATPASRSAAARASLTARRPIGFCDGSAEDLAELERIAEAEGADEMVITKKRLKTGREIWTLGSSG